MQEVAPLKRGEYTSNSTELDHLLGQEYYFQDINLASSNSVKPKLTGALVRCRLVKNGTGSAILPKRGVVYQATYGLMRVNGYSAANGRCDGVVDEYVAAAGVPDGRNFWLVIGGPTTMENDGTTTIAEFDTVTTGATGYVLTEGSPPTAGDVGIALAAETTGVAGADVRVFFGHGWMGA